MPRGFYDPDFNLDDIANPYSRVTGTISDIAIVKDSNTFNVYVIYSFQDFPKLPSNRIAWGKTENFPELLSDGLDKGIYYIPEIKYEIQSLLNERSRDPEVVEYLLENYYEEDLIDFVSGFLTRYEEEEDHFVDIGPISQESGQYLVELMFEYLANVNY